MLWREARLCLARAAGLGARTHVHGVGDCAPWILNQFQEQFGAQRRYLVDFYHVSGKLAAAATAIRPTDLVGWRRRQQGRLLDNKVGAVLRALAAYGDPGGAGKTPVRDAQRYLSDRRAHLDYAGARARGLCLGSGEVESGHRHVIQQRLKLAGSWWTEPHAEAMLGLRAARANHRWERYWLTSEFTRS